MQKHDLEMAGLLKRIKSGREEQKLARKQELQRLLQRYHNVKSQLESSQNIVRVKYVLHLYEFKFNTQIENFKF